MLNGKYSRLGQLIAIFVVGWCALVPLHEALHVLGCLATGGSVTRLEISPLYGGDLFARFFPWITSESEYAGRLSGFRPAGDLSYLVTVLAPLVVLCAAGSPLSRLAIRRRQPWLLGLGLSAALQPLAALPGDCYEAASIPITRLASLAGPDWALRLRGDDLGKVAAQAAATQSLLAWALFAAGCVGGVLIAAATLIACGGIAPRTSRPRSRHTPRHWTRRSVLRAGVGAVLVGFGGWLLQRVYFPRRLAAVDRETLAALMDVLGPTAEFPPPLRAALLERLVEDGESKRQTRRALVEGVRLLNHAARDRGARDFVTLDRDQQEAVVEACAAAAEGSLPLFFYRTVRGRTMQLVYSQPLAWRRLRFPHPPQPDGYPNYREPPDA